MILLSFVKQLLPHPLNVSADRLGIHAVVRDALIAASVISIGEAVCRTVNLVCFGVVYTLISESCIALLLTDDVLTLVAVFPRGHDPVHCLIEISADLL